ncbi:hypothetical protein LINPERHAP1_LOCUS36058 [Linum perenne]
MEQRTPTFSTAAVDKVKQDRISLLPDEVIHHILARLKSIKEAAKTIFLSKRWTRLWLSYPVLEFNGWQFQSRVAQQSFITAVLNKFLKDGAPPLEAVRVTLYCCSMGKKLSSAFLDGVFKCIAKASPREIDIATSCFNMLGTTKYPIPEGFLLQIGDNKFGCLKRSIINHLFITGFPTFPTLTDKKLNKMINELPHLELLILKNLPQIHNLKIVNKDKLRVIELHSWHSEQPSVIEIDAPLLTNLVYNGNDSRYFPTIFFNKSRCDCGADSQPIKLPSFCLGVYGYLEFDKLKQFLAKLSQFRVTVKFGHFPPQALSCRDTELLTPVVERVKIFPHLPGWDIYAGLLDGLLWSCHPKYLSFNRRIHRLVKHRFVSDHKFLCEVFMEKDSNEDCVLECNCWRHQLKDVKMIRRVRTGSVEEDTLMDISTELTLSLLISKNGLAMLHLDCPGSIIFGLLVGVSTEQ